MKPTSLFLRVSLFTFGTCAFAGTVLGAAEQLFEGIQFDSGSNSTLVPQYTSGSGWARNSLEMITWTGGITLFSATDPSSPTATVDGGVNLWGNPIRIVLESTGYYPDNATFEVTRGTGFYNSQTPLFKIDASNGNSTFTESDVSINQGDLSVGGALSVTGNQTVTGTLSAGGSQVITSASAASVLTGQNFVQLGSGGVLNIVSTTDSTSSTTGAVTVAGGLGVAKDSYINGVKIGRGAGSAPAVFTTNIAIGPSVLSANTSAKNNTAVGVNALENHVSGDNNTAVGFQALRASTTATNNTALGYAALTTTTTGASNTALGAHSLRVNTTGSANSVMGLSAMQNNTTGSANTALGVGSLNVNTTGGSNTAVGYVALGGNTTGTLNVGIGYSAGRYRVGDSTPLNNTNSIYIGSHTRGLAAADDNSIVIGTNGEGAGSNTTVIGNSATTHTYLKGETNSASLRVTGATVLEGDVVLAEAQGDISMGDYQ